MSGIHSAFSFFEQHYADRLGVVKSINFSSLKHQASPPTLGQDLEQLLEAGLHEHSFILESDRLKPGNGPRIFHHGDQTEDVIVLTHGYTDSPYYLQSVALGFHKAGFNVVMPLLPAHGLRDLGEALEDKTLDQQWRNTIDHAVDTAALLGKRISIGGFSTGGALSVNKVLTDEKNQINGGLFLFSAAISVGYINEALTRLKFLQPIARIIEGGIPGIGRDPFKYPGMSNAGGMEVAQIINDNNRLLRDEKAQRKIAQPVFAAHSTHDKTATLAGLMEFMKDHVERGVAIVISHDVEHACLPLDRDIRLQDGEGELAYFPIANPKFRWMMKGILEFVEREVRNHTND